MVYCKHSVGGHAVFFWGYKSILVYHVLYKKVNPFFRNNADFMDSSTFSRICPPVLFGAAPATLRKDFPACPTGNGLT
jgi:hypothetical protein